MPVILRPEDWDTWLSPRPFQPSAFPFQHFLAPWPGPMLARPVTTWINKAAYDGPVEEVPLPQSPPEPENELRLF